MHNGSFMYKAGNTMKNTSQHFFFFAELMAVSWSPKRRASIGRRQAKLFNKLRNPMDLTSLPVQSPRVSSGGTAELA